MITEMTVGNVHFRRHAADASLKVHFVWTWINATQTHRIDHPSAFEFSVRNARAEDLK